MGLEGAVKLGFKKEIEAVSDPEEKQMLYEKLVKAAYDKGKAVNAAHALEFDEVIDPAETRAYLAGALEALPKNSGSGRFIDTW